MHFGDVCIVGETNDSVALCSTDGRKTLVSLTTKLDSNVLLLHTSHESIPSAFSIDILNEMRHTNGIVHDNQRLESSLGALIEEVVKNLL